MAEVIGLLGGRYSEADKVVEVSVYLFSIFSESLKLLYLNCCKRYFFRASTSSILKLKLIAIMLKCYLWFVFKCWLVSSFMRKIWHVTENSLNESY